MTGGSIGLGKATVELLLSNNAYVIILDLEEPIIKNASLVNIENNLDYQKINITCEKEINSGFNFICDKYKK